MIAPDLSIETMQQAKEAIRRGEIVDLPSPHAPAVKGIDERRKWPGNRAPRERSTT